MTQFYFGYAPIARALEHTRRRNGRVTAYQYHPRRTPHYTKLIAHKNSEITIEEINKEVFDSAAFWLSQKDATAYSRWDANGRRSMAAIIVPE